MEYRITSIYEYRTTNRGGMNIMNIIASWGDWNKNREDTPASPGKRYGTEETKIASRRNESDGMMNIITS